jgi:NADPH:quinone reductase-like Zn-dependent oxidoreductase
MNAQKMNDSKMKAAVYHQYGPPDVVKVTNIDKPVPKDGEVLVKVHATTVNRTDAGFRSAEYFIVRLFAGLFKPKNPVLGCEFAGVVESVGKTVNSFKPGDRVFGFDDNKWGGHAAYKVIAEKDAIVHIPDSIPYTTAAAISEGAHYAWCNIRAAKITKGQKVIVNGATGAIGSAAVQLIKNIGAEVVAVCHTDHIDLVKSLGPDRVIDYTQQDFTELDTLFDVVFDAVGKSSFGKCKRILKPKGIYMSTELGKNAENPFLAMWTPLLGGKKVLFPLPYSNKEDLIYLSDLVARDLFTPVLDKQHFTFDQICEAYTYVETGQKIGNVVIEM